MELFVTVEPVSVTAEARATVLFKKSVPLEVMLEPRVMPVVPVRLIAPVPAPSPAATETEPLVLTVRAAAPLKVVF